MVRRRVTTGRPGVFDSAGLGGAACLVLGGLDVGHEGVVREPVAFSCAWLVVWLP